MNDDDESNGSLSRQASEFLRGEIISGYLKPGSIIQIEELSTPARYSAAVMREGLSRLLASQLVVCVDGAFQVADQNADDLADLLHTRFLLEGVALRDSIMGGDHEWERSVETDLENLLAVAPDKWITPEALAIHKRFHQALISASRLRRVVSYLDSVYDQYIWYAVAGRTRYSSEAGGYQRLADAALSRNPEAATEQLRMLLFVAAHANGNGTTLSDF